VVSSFPSICETVLHMAASDKIWLERLKKFAQHELLINTFNGSKDELIKFGEMNLKTLKSSLKIFPLIKLMKNWHLRI
jgi:uncharacterized damage-inducible protein DinB